MSKKKKKHKKRSCRCRAYICVSLIFFLALLTGLAGLAMYYSAKGMKSYASGDGDTKAGVDKETAKTAANKIESSTRIVFISAGVLGGVALLLLVLSCILGRRCRCCGLVCVCCGSVLGCIASCCAASCVACWHLIDGGEDEESTEPDQHSKPVESDSD